MENTGDVLYLDEYEVFQYTENDTTTVHMTSKRLENTRPV